MATAVASGVVANMIDANRRDEGASSVLTPNMVKAILQFTAIPVRRDPDSATPMQLEQGAGSLNADGAVRLTRAINPSAPVGTPWLESRHHAGHRFRRRAAGRVGPAHRVG